MNKGFIGASIKQLNILRRAIGLNTHTCYYCEEKIDFRKAYSIFPSPDRLVCNSILCVAESTEEENNGVR